MNQISRKIFWDTHEISLSKHEFDFLHLLVMASDWVIDSTYVEEKHLNEAGKIDYYTLKPVLFEFPTYEYLKTGDVIGNGLSFKSK